jgi:dTDP-4-dehydrorhamnose reductase
MRVIVCGSAGQLGREVVRIFRDAGDDVSAFDLDLDITDYDLVMKKIPPLKPGLLINAAADTDLDRAELDPDPSLKANFTGPQNLALACLESACPMVFISTDYVFDGEKKDMYTEFDEPNPQGVYAKCKLAGERYLASVLSRYFIFRTAWLFGMGESRNFVRSILHNAKQKGSLRVVTDEVGNPTYARDLAETIHRVCLSEKYGLYHATNDGICSRFEFAQQILEEAGWKDVPVEPIQRADLDLPCPRPPYSPLDNMNLRLQGFPPMRHYRDALREYVPWLIENSGF